MIPRTTIIGSRPASPPQRNIMCQWLAAILGYVSRQVVADCSHHRWNCRCEMCTEISFGPQDICSDCGRSTIKCRCGGPGA